MSDPVPPVPPPVTEPELPFPPFRLWTGLLIITGLLVGAVSFSLHTLVNTREQAAEYRRNAARIAGSIQPSLTALLPLTEATGTDRADTTSPGTDPTPLTNRRDPLSSRLSKHLQEISLWSGLLELSILDASDTVLFSTNPALQTDPAPLLADLRQTPWILSAEPSPVPTSRQSFRLFEQVFSGHNISQQIVAMGMGTGTGTPVRAVMVFRLTTPSSDLTHGLTGVLTIAVPLAMALLAIHALSRRTRALRDSLDARLTAQAETDQARRRLHDIMEQTIAQRTRRLRDSEGRFRDFAMSSSDWLWETDTQNRFTYVSDGIRRLLGLDPDQIIGRTRSELQAIPYDETKRWETYLATLRARRPFRNFTYRILDGSGQERIHSISGTPIFDNNGVFGGYRGSGTDITDQYRAMKALVESEDRYHSVADLSLDALIVHLNGHIVFVNNRAVAITRATTDQDLIGRPVTDFVPETSLQQVQEQFDQVQNSQQMSERREIRLKRIDGTPFEAEVGSAPIIHDGQPAVLTLMRDITTRKTVQTQLIQTAKLATLGEMAAGMAHELSQPMNIIRMAAEGTLLTEGPTLSDQTRKGLEVIAGQAGRMGDIIDHMRVFSRKQTPSADLFDPQLCIREAINMVEAQFYAETITMSVRYPNQPTRVLGQPVHLEQVLLNLLTNARDSLRARSRTELPDSGWNAAINVRASVDGAGDILLIDVADSGTGIPADVLDRIFEPFYTTKEVGSGTGLGLSVSFGLISAMGGSISARNEDSGGAVFTVSLPLTQATDGVSMAPDLNADRPRPTLHQPRILPAPTENSDTEEDEPSALIGHILVVDDEPAAAILIRDHLRAIGYRVTMAHDGAKAYDLFLEDPPDLLITDLRMPRVGGLELMARLHRHIPDLPVIIMTGHIGQSDLSPEEIETVAVAVLRKPIRLTDLTALVEANLPEDLHPSVTPAALPS